MSPNWISSKKATINPKNEKDNECFKWSVIAGLNYNKIEEKELKKLLKLKRVDTKITFKSNNYHTKDTGKILEKKIIQQLLIFYSHHIIVKK